MSRKIIVNTGPYETRAAILEDDRPVELFFEIKDSEKIVGHIYKGKVSNILPGTQAAFVDIGLPKDAYLTLTGVENTEGDDEEELKDIFRSPIQDMLKVGQEVILQILKEPTPTKGPRSTMALSFPGRYLVLMPNVEHIGVSRRISQEKERERLKAIGRKLAPKGGGIIFRTAAEGIEEQDLADDLNLLVKMWQKVEAKARKAPPRSLIHRDLSLTMKLVRDHLNDDVDRMIVDSREEYQEILETCDFLSPLQRAALELYEGKEPIFEAYGIEKEIEMALESKVWLDSGAYLIFDKTEAMVTIDVNSGRFSGGADLEETVSKVNLEAAKVIARQIRLRNLAGIIIIDFIDMHEAKNRQKVLKAFREGFKGDRNRPHILDFSELGLVQMTRKRTSASLDEILKEKCPCCEGRGKTLAIATLANRIRRQVLQEAARIEGKTITVRAHERVVEFLRAHHDQRLKELERRSNRTIHLHAEKGLALDFWKVEAKLNEG
ncbi:MAG: Cytoplasmic axial filament protein CafA and Ribonuclease G [Candidatus Ozemobacter sibiricus]|uniref:Ribonuclease G n=1 Tax=Candidatus Ozemobacter sibiricus TaxID=2268124 RepID=A0A367ZJ35_9BACT|nr:MAG: Cytoplasmic axial filament protein CafA and Ribonuclease G [Candidatus Ozemobacter sibiricus]